MSRNHEKLKVFEIADLLVIDVYRLKFPSEERFGIQSQVRRAAVSVPTNIVEGCARRTETDFLKFLNIALASATETQYLLALSKRLTLVADDQELIIRYGGLVRAIQALINSFS